jgi:CheY-like chemotaxis protein
VDCVRDIGVSDRWDKRHRRQRSNGSRRRARALRHRVADSPDRKTARLLPTLGDEEPISIGLPGDKLRSVAGRNIRGGFSLWLRLATVCALVACATISGMRPTVLIVDDHAAFRASARALLQAEGFDIVGEATDGAEAVEAVAVLRPEIVLLDIQLPDLDGLALAEQLAAVPDAPAVVLISSRDAAAYGPRLQATPARGFIPKRGLSGEALAALTG